MKTIILFLGSLSLAFSIKAQSMRHFTNKNIIKPFDLEITSRKTTMLVFPAPVQSADRGARYILAEKASGTDNILKVKAGQDNFQPSNLHVITTDGQLYSFRVRYAEEPPYQALDLRQDAPLQDEAPVDFSGQSYNSNQLAQWVDAVSRAPANIKGMVRRKQGLIFRLDGIYRNKNLLFFRFSIKDKPEQRTRIDTVRFYTQEKRQSKRTAVQTRNIPPLSLKYYRNHSSGVAVLKQFKWPTGKHLFIQITAKRGNWMLSLEVPNRRLFKATRIEESGACSLP